MFTVKRLIEILKEFDENDYVNVSEKIGRGGDLSKIFVNRIYSYSDCGVVSKEYYYKEGKERDIKYLEGLNRYYKRIIIENAKKLKELLASNGNDRTTEEFNDLLCNIKFFVTKFKNCKDRLNIVLNDKNPSYIELSANMSINGLLLL